MAGLLALPECWPFRIQVVLTSDADLPEAKHVLILKRVHGVTNVMADLRLQFQHESAKDCKRQRNRRLFGEQNLC